MHSSRMIELTEKAERHLAVHFGDSNAAGSVFFKNVFEDIILNKSSRFEVSVFNSSS